MCTEPWKFRLGGASPGVGPVRGAASAFAFSPPTQRGEGGDRWQRPGLHEVGVVVPDGGPAEEGVGDGVEGGGPVLLPVLRELGQCQPHQAHERREVGPGPDLSRNKWGRRTITSVFDEHRRTDNLMCEGDKRGWVRLKLRFEWGCGAFRYGPRGSPDHCRPHSLQGGPSAAHAGPPTALARRSGGGASPLRMYSLIKNHGRRLNQSVRDVDK